jgi:asparagine synthase (glutamine-hydrolysing)
MCGIFGGIWPDAPATIERDVVAAAWTLHFRGPDDSGVERLCVNGATVILGHTRLSIIDLSSGGHQPMFSRDGRYSLVFNGEIYNYRELRRELASCGHEFSSNSDTAVLLAAWIEWGEKCLSRLVGMFAFVVVDRELGEATCVRDAFGIKPLFYLESRDEFLFGSEIGAIRALSTKKLGLDWQCAYDYLVHGSYDNGERTFFADVRHLCPGHLIRVDIATGRAERSEAWWKPRIVEATAIKFSSAVEMVREAFLQSIRLHLRSDVPLGAALSGGVDSSAIVCAMRHVEPDLPINTFSFIAEGAAVNEEKWVDTVNRHVGAHAHKVSISPDELVRDLDDMIRAQGEPFGSMSIYAQYRVYQLAKQSGVTVTLDGQGADEILGGYLGFPGERVRSFIDAGNYGGALAFLDKWSKWPGRGWASGLRAALAECSDGVVHEGLRCLSGMNRIPDWIDAGAAADLGITPRVGRFRSGSDAKGRRVVAQMLNMLTRHGLPALLRHGDRNSMRFSVESRVPFLSLELVELMLSMPESYLVSPCGETKHVFRKAMQGIVPDEILFRKDKIGFEPPERDWILSIAAKAREWLSEDMNIPFVRRESVLAGFEDVISGRQPFSWQVWRWINFYRWKACVAD